MYYSEYINITMEITRLYKGNALLNCPGVLTCLVLLCKLFLNLAVNYFIVIVKLGELVKYSDGELPVGKFNFICLLLGKLEQGDEGWGETCQRTYS